MVMKKKKKKKKKKSYKKCEEEKEGEEADMPLKEKPSASQIRETLNLLFNFTLIAGYEEMQHIATKHLRRLK